MCFHKSCDYVANSVSTLRQQQKQMQMQICICTCFCCCRTVKYREYAPPHPRGFRTFFKSVYQNINQNYTIPEKLHSKINFRQAMRKNWSEIFSKSKKTPQIEEKPYRCVICNSNSVRFSFARIYVCHMKTLICFTIDMISDYLSHQQGRYMSFQRLKRKR